MSLKCQSRLCASAIHFSVSLLVFSLFLLVLLKLWYPTPYFSASGGWQGLKLVAFVDLVLGPLLTLIVYNIKKPKKALLTDLLLIFFLQSAVLTWGIIQVYQQRPVATVFWDNQFYTVPANALVKQGVDLKTLKQFGSTSPVYIYAQKPDSVEKWYKLIDNMNKNNLPPHHMSALYRPLDEHFDDIYQFDIDIDEVMRSNATMKSEIESIIKQSGTVFEENHYQKLESRYRNVILIFNKNNKLIGFANAPYKD